MESLDYLIVFLYHSDILSTTVSFLNLKVKMAYYYFTMFPLFCIHFHYFCMYVMYLTSLTYCFDDRMFSMSFLSNDRAAPQTLITLISN